ncbi:uncharacterized protein [Temnothorax nylanderi]|uniref:uncharacterized protein n=1 Tax=Temnothorax nylanderi TaxID=102681 RepID=UPI003A845F43
MYRQILVDEEQVSLQSILWRPDSESEIEEVELLTITYGTKPASFLATECLEELAEAEKINYPEAAEVIENDTYMDDILIAHLVVFRAKTKAKVMKLKKDLTEVLAKGGFQLHKWNTNIATSDKDMYDQSEAVDISKEAESKLLGILWNPSRDTFHYKVSLSDCETRVTKRAVLSQICRLFDPLGLVGPVITSAKILMQELWSLGIEWDESVSMHIHRAWDQIKSQLRLLNKLKIPRLVVSGDDDS